MAEITAAMVAKLRAETDVGMMECKKALVEANGDFDVARDIIRIKSGAKANKVADRSATEGVVVVATSNSGKFASILELNCETDFVAKQAELSDFAKAVAQIAANKEINDISLLAVEQLDANTTIDQKRQELVSKFGENLVLGKLQTVAISGIGANYIHSNKKIGVLLDIVGGSAELGRDIAMHIAACKPIYCVREMVPEDIVAKEREIYAIQARESGKPEELIDKMVSGRVEKFFNEIVLFQQSYIKDSDQRISDVLKKNGATINWFVRFEVGNSTNFVAKSQA